MRHFCESCNLKSQIKVPACCKNSESPSCIDLILTNKRSNFQNSCVIETSLSDFHKMTVIALRMQFRNRSYYFLEITRNFQMKLSKVLLNSNWIPNPLLLMKIDF